MPKEPTGAIFTCESCGRSSTADARMANHLLPFMRRLPIQANGMCRSCAGDRWTISVVFVESGVDAESTAIGIGLAAATGVGFTSTTTSSNQTDYSGVPADIVAWMNEIPRDRLLRVAEFAREKERDKLKQQGGRECASCGILFVPTQGQLWAERGYCSKMCLVEVEGATAVMFAGGAAQDTRKSNAISVECASGHRFNVQEAFQGMLRPCPVCGEKTRVG